MACRRSSCCPTAARADDRGATEIGRVANPGKVLGGAWDYVAAEINLVPEACLRAGALLKVIFENDYRQDRHIIHLSAICMEAGVAFVKTSTGYGFVRQPEGGYNYRGATDHHRQLMRQHRGPGVRLKAAGGVRTRDDLLRVRALGVARVGATATKAMLADAMQRGFPGPAPPGLEHAAQAGDQPSGH